MTLKSKYAEKINEFIESHKNEKTGSLNVEIGGEVRRVPTYKIPISFLRYNINNGRIKMEIREWEIKNRRELSNIDLEDIKIIQRLLIEQSSTDAELLKEDLRRKGQLDAGVITHDGIVINANRRMAVYQELHREDASGIWESLEVAVLPATVSHRDLWRIEAGLQLSKDKKVEYHPVNELLKIREGIDAGLKPFEIAAAMFGRNEKYVKEGLERLDLIDGFLEYIDEPKNYGLIKVHQLHESFINIHSRVTKHFDSKGMPPQRILQLVEYSYALIHASIEERKKGKKGVRHLDIRKLKQVFEDDDATDTFIKNIKNANDPKDISSEEIIEDFKTAVDLCELRNERNKPLTLLVRAYNALTSIDTNNLQYRENAVKLELGRIKRQIDQMWRELEGN
ncbi:MAG: hypothetical protein Phog2KO_23950 [Phototrophicaceae bacterium]